MGFSYEQLLERLRAIEALRAGATTPGERVAAERARERIVERLQALRRERAKREQAWFESTWREQARREEARRERERREPPIVEHRFSIEDAWTRRLFMALLARYDIRPYQYPRQRRSTVMARMSHRFRNETLWPEFLRLSRMLHYQFGKLTDWVIEERVHGEGRAPGASRAGR